MRPTVRRRNGTVRDFVYQLTIFPHGAHDDDVDAFTQLLARWQARRPVRSSW